VDHLDRSRAPLDLDRKRIFLIHLKLYDGDGDDDDDMMMIMAFIIFLMIMMRDDGDDDDDDNYENDYDVLVAIILHFDVF
jgi:hypothetical protein